jgi:hypothetical protein
VEEFVKDKAPDFTDKATQAAKTVVTKVRDAAGGKPDGA